MAIAFQPLSCSNVAHADTRANVSQSIKNTSSTETPTGSAREVFRTAYENRYTWNKQFPGYTATVEFKQGKENNRGHVRINPDLSVEVSGVNSEDARQIDSQLRMIIVHRRQVPFEVAHKNQTYQFGATDKTGAVEIFEQGDTTDSHYKVFHQQLTQVNRTLGQMAVTVNLLDSLVTPEGYLATRYRTIFRQPETAQVLGEQESQDTYNKVGGYYLLTRQVIHDFESGKQTAVEIDFTDIKLL